MHGTLNIDAERGGNCVRGEGRAQLARAGSMWEFAKSAPLDAHVVAAIPNLDVIAPWLGPDTKMGGRFDADVHRDGHRCPAHHGRQGAHPGPHAA